MALTISEATRRTINLPGAYSFCYHEEELKSFSQRGYGYLEGFDCKIVNVLGPSSFKVLVNKDWFKQNEAGCRILKPRMNKGTANGFDFQLIPTNEKLFAIYYIDLFLYCLKLERDRNEWFSKTYWGIHVDETDETFRWAGGNTLTFPLLKITGPEALAQKAAEYNRTPRKR